MKLSIIVALGRNGVIGRSGVMPWKLRDDLRWFKEVTMGHPVIMGRNTWDSLLVKPLPGRSNFVVGTRPIDCEGVERHETPESALLSAREQAVRDGVGQVFVIGGGQLYSWALPRADCLYMSEIEAEPEGDVIFPIFSDWERCGESRCFEAGGGNEYAFSTQIWRRRLR